MSEASQTSYDEIPYGSNVFSYSHPDRLATLATLLGMSPPSVDRCRVLELGCGTGTNLICMAVTLSQSRFVGIDLSPRQIAMGQEIVQTLGLTNVELKALSLMDVDEQFGQFDYILCHGVYSWVPEPVQDRILTICARNLAPNGVAYVSYNTYPGWHLRGMVREMMRFHVRQFDEPVVRIEQARALLEFLLECVGESKNVYGEMLKTEAEMLEGTGDTYLYHEHLEEVNYPVYFHQFAERAAAHRLQYLAEAQPTALPITLSPSARETLERISVDLIHGEQYLDFVRNRTFRRTLLCHAAIPLQRPPRPQTVLHLQLAARLQPNAPTVDLDPRTAVEFQSVEKISLTVQDPLLKAALVYLLEVWPRIVPFETLWNSVVERVRQALPPGAVPDDLDSLPLADALLQCFLSNLVELHVHAPEFTIAVSERPSASPLVRLQAQNGNPITSLRHRAVEVTGFERQLLPFLDGSRTQTEVLETLISAVARGDLHIEREGQPLRDVDRIHELMSEALEPSLQRLARCALFIR
jgi:SAM-dependent methyltransferase/methyltransferase-like protein